MTSTLKDVSEILRHVLRDLCLYSLVILQCRGWFGELQRTEYNNTILTFDVQKPRTAVWHLVKKKMTLWGKEKHNTEQSKEVLNKSVSARRRKSLTDAFNKI